MGWFVSAHLGFSGVCASWASPISKHSRGSMKTWDHTGSIAGMLDGTLRSWKLVLRPLAGLTIEQMVDAFSCHQHVLENPTRLKSGHKSQLQFDRGLGRAELVVKCHF